MEFDNQHLTIFINNTMSVLNKLPEVDSFLGTLDLKTGSMIISALCVLHPTIYGCTFFMPVSYLLLTIWFLLALFFTASVLLFYGLTNNDILLISTWICYSLLFVATMFLMMFLLALFFITKAQKFKVFIVLLGILWYILTIYFILVVNSHRKALVDVAIAAKRGGSPQTPVSNKELEKTPEVTDDQNAPGSGEEADPLRIKDRLKALRKASAIKKRRS